MPNRDWSQLTKLQLGRYAEYYAKMEFASCGFEIYTPKVDDHGVDFLAKLNGNYYEIQVKAQRKGSPYTFIKKSKMDITDPRRLVYLIQFFLEEESNLFAIPATAWQAPISSFYCPLENSLI